MHQLQLITAKSFATHRPNLPAHASLSCKPVGTLSNKEVDLYSTIANRENKVPIKPPQSWILQKFSSGESLVLASIMRYGGDYKKIGHGYKKLNRLISKTKF